MNSGNRTYVFDAFFFFFFFFFFFGGGGYLFSCLLPYNTKFRYFEIQSPVLGLRVNGIRLYIDERDKKLENVQHTFPVAIIHNNYKIHTQQSFVLFVLILNVQINYFSHMSGRIFPQC